MKNKCVWLGSFLLIWLLFCVSAAQAGGSDYASFSSERTLNIGDTTTMWFPGPTGTYQWYIWVDDVMQEIPGATDDEYTTGPITKPVKYTCVGTFENGLSESRDFMIYLKTNLEAEAAGSSELILHPDQQAVLRVQASVDTGAVSYQWYRNNMQEILEGENASVCVIGPFSDREIIGCRVYDEFGNSKDVLFSIRIDSGLRAEAVLSETWIQPGQSAVLKVNASADYGAVSYQWYGEGGDAELDGQISSTYTTRPLNKSAVYTCTVSDDYGSIREIRFFVRIENGFHAEAVGSELRLVDEGEDVTLSVNASCQEGSLSYCWRDVETNSVLSTESSLTIENVTESRKYRCLASDENGNGRYIEFMVVRRNGVRHSRPVMFIEGSTYETVLAISFEAESSGWYELGASFEESGADNISLFDSRGRLIATEYISVEMNHLKVKLTEGDTDYFEMDGIRGEGIF